MYFGYIQPPPPPPPQIPFTSTSNSLPTQLYIFVFLKPMHLEGVTLLKKMDISFLRSYKTLVAPQLGERLYASTPVLSLFLGFCLT